MKNINSTVRRTLLVLFAIAMSSKIAFTQIGVFYPFNGNANDESGVNNHGNVTGATLTTDRFNNVNSAYYFDGVDNYIESTTSLNITGDSPRSCVLWIKPTDQINKKQGLIYWGVNNVDYEKCFFSLKNFNDGIDFNGVYADASYDHFFPVDEWAMVGYIYEGNGDISFIVNGTVVGSTNLGANLDTPHSTLKIGSESENDFFDWEAYFKGSIDDVQIYGYAMSPEEVQILYQQGGWGEGGFTGGSGTEMDPYQISTLSDLQFL